MKVAVPKINGGRTADSGGVVEFFADGILIISFAEPRLQSVKVGYILYCSADAHDPALSTFSRYQLFQTSDLRLRVATLSTPIES